jgi:hypothetical protein
MKHHIARLLAGIVLVLAVAAPSAFATPVTVRIEGNTMAGTVVVNTTGSGVPGNASCQLNSAAEALDKATLGNWDRQTYVSTILGESHTYTHNDYWAFWINGSYSATQGICDYIVQPGDEVLLYPQVDGPGFQGTVFPLYFASVPAAVSAGVPYTVSVIKRVSDGTTTTSQPAVGVTVDDGASTATTDANGQATLTTSTPGAFQLVAYGPDAVNSPRRTVTAVAVAAPVAPTTPTAAPEAPPAPVAPDTPPIVQTEPSIADTQVPIATIAGLRNRQHFRKHKGPRELKGSVADSGALKSVEVRLRRKSGKRCFGFSAKRERFTRMRCSRDARWFSVGSTADWSYLLPKRLPRGLYQLQVRATDVAGNRSTNQSLRFRVA